MHFLGATRPAMVFVSCKRAENFSRKAGIEVCEESFFQVFNSEKKPTFEQKLIKLPVHECIINFI